VIVFVGDCPSQFNTDPNVAFVGTKSGKVLDEWIQRMGIVEAYLLINSHEEHLVWQIVRYYETDNNVIIALGNSASKRLDDAHVPHFKLPHPSPKNFKLNDKQYVISELKKCAEYVAGKVSVYNANYSC